MTKHANEFVHRINVSNVRVYICVCTNIYIYMYKHISMPAYHKYCTSKSNDSYRKYICKNNKDAESASWPRLGRACEPIIRFVFSRF